MSGVTTGRATFDAWTPSIVDCLSVGYVPRLPPPNRSGIVPRRHTDPRRCVLATVPPRQDDRRYRPTALHTSGTFPCSVSIDTCSAVDSAVGDEFVREKPQAMRDLNHGRSKLLPETNLSAIARRCSLSFAQNARAPRDLNQRKTHSVRLPGLKSTTVFQAIGDEFVPQKPRAPRDLNHGRSRLLPETNLSATVRRCSLSFAQNARALRDLNPRQRGPKPRTLSRLS